MTTLFITGDRRMDPITSAMVTVSALNKFAKAYGKGEKIDIYTGGFETGIERAVRYLVPDVNVILHDDDEAGKPKLDERHRLAAETADFALMIHGDPLASKIGKSLADHFQGDKLIFA